MKKLTNSTKVLRYIRKNPKAKASEVAKAVGVSINSVYQCTYNAKKKAKSLPMTALAPVNRVPPKRGRPSKVKTFFATSNKSIKADNVNHPPHYKAGGIETIDFIEAKSLNYNLGNVVKYITRADHKGNKLEDLQKAQWYLNREIKNLSK
jgi:predicted ArsR family transcriptional regulator